MPDTCFYCHKMLHDHAYDVSELGYPYRYACRECVVSRTEDPDFDIEKLRVDDDE